MPRELRANVFSHGWGVIVQVFVPGCAMNDVRVRLNGDILTVCASLPARESGIPVMCERETGESEREFALSADLDVAHITRTLQDGVLTMVIPRRNGFEIIASS